jgi:hypothetical protein
MEWLLSLLKEETWQFRNIEHRAQKDACAAITGDT